MTNSLTRTEVYPMPVGDILNQSALSQLWQAVTLGGRVKQVWISVGTMNIASHNDGAGNTESITVKGAAVGDICTFTLLADMDQTGWTASVSAADTVEINFGNLSGQASDPADASYLLEVKDVT